MGLRNAFQDLATEATVERTRVVQETRDRELLENILTELKILNLHMSMLTDEIIEKTDLEK